MINTAMYSVVVSFSYVYRENRISLIFKNMLYYSNGICSNHYNIGIHRKVLNFLKTLFIRACTQNS